MHVSPTIVSDAPLTPAQERFLLTNRRAGGAPLHNLPVGWRIRGALDVEMLATALGCLAERHEALRTRYPIRPDGSAVQEVLGRWRPELERYAIEGPEPAGERVRAWRQPIVARTFALAERPPFRCCLARLGREDHALLLVFHHIAFDGWSYGVVVRDLGAAYTALAAGEEPRLPGLPLRFGEYAKNLREWLRSEEAERQRRQWAEILADLPAELDLPADKDRSRNPTWRVERVRHVLPAEFRGALEEFAQANRATPFAVLMAALQALIAGRTGSRDFVIGFPLANRQDRADLRGLVGCFINLLPLRADLSGTPSFLDVVRRVKRAAFDAFPYQRLPFDEIVKVVPPTRALSRVMFNYRDYANPRLRLGELECEDLEYDPGTSAVDLSVEVIAFHAGSLVLELEYAVDVFDRATIDGFAADYAAILREGVRAPHLPVAMPISIARGRPSVETAAERRECAPAPPEGRGSGERLDDLERVLLPLWREILGMPHVGPHDDFFDIGGQSLQAVHLVSTVERVFGGRVPLGWIFEYPTVARLAAAIANRPPEPSEGPEFLIPFRSSGARAPLFCVHGVRGGVFVFREVARLLGPDQPVYGFMLVGRPLDRIPSSVEAMAERYIDEMRSVQPEGPYRVVGYSFGCLVAYEMACRLAARGEQVAMVGLIGPPRKLPALRPVWRVLRRGTIRRKSERPPSIHSICVAATYWYRPRPYPARVVYFQEEETSGHERLWRSLASGGLDIRPVPGDHSTVLRSRNAVGFARQLEDALGSPSNS